MQITYWTCPYERCSKESSTNYKEDKLVDYILENALIVTEKSKDNKSVLKVYADRILALQKENEGKEDEKDA